ncbi:hypothetical protein Bca101_053940 [Brassica carinata]
MILKLVMLQGGIEDGEDPRSAAMRELQEETGVVSAAVIAEVPNWLTYDFPPAVKAKVNRLWGGGEWHGQAQKCVLQEERMNGSFIVSENGMNPHRFLVRLMNDEDGREINLANNEADSEFAEWKWARPEEVIEQAVDYKRPTYEQVIKSFGSYLNDIHEELLNVNQPSGNKII